MGRLPVGEGFPAGTRVNFSAGGANLAIVHASLVFWGLLLIPLAVFATAIHFLETWIQHRLVSRFGWRSVLVTGWLGTPIHELSHAAMCLLFGHRIDELQLFDPDLEDGRLGYVRHSYRRGNWFEEAGNLFIGVAPLLGGSLALVAVSLLFYPSAMTSVAEAVRQFSAAEIQPFPWGEAAEAVISSCWQIVSRGDPATLRFWIYAYLVVCIASHMAPSRSDYAGALRGAVVVGILAFLVTVLVFSLVRQSPATMAVSVLSLLAPFFAVAVLALALVGCSTLFVWILTFFFPVRWQKK